MIYDGGNVTRFLSDYLRILVDQNKKIISVGAERMVPYEQFVFRSVKKINLAALIIGLAIALAYQKADFLIVPKELWVHATAFRFGFVAPLFLISIYFCLAEKQNQFLVAISILVSVTTVFWYAMLASSGSTSLNALVAVSIQAIAFCSLLLHLPFKIHLGFLLLLGFLSLLVLVSGVAGNPRAAAAFGFGMTGLITLSAAWVHSREKRYRELYHSLARSIASINTRGAWNEFMINKVDVLRTCNLPEIQASLDQLSINARKLSFTSRAKDSLQEINHLMTRFGKNTEWVNFDNRKDIISYSVEQHLESLISELRARYADSYIELAVRKDFKTYLEKDLFSRLITNLVENASRAADPGSQITITITAHKSVTIENFGPPLASPFVELVQPGKQSIKSGKFGLGLYICAKICSANGIKFEGKNTPSGVCMELDFEPEQNVYKFNGND